MADFDPPFAEDGERRLPTTTEQSLGMGCDPDQLRELLNGLHWLVQANINNLAQEAGQTSASAGDATLLYRSVQALIDSISGSAPEGYILMDQARARLPIFPDVLNDDGHLGVVYTAPGNVRVPAGKTFLHRGIFSVTTVQTDLATDASKNYHLRWNPTDGFTLKDLVGGGAYNPTTAAESNAGFDSTYDDMLVARVVTNSSNVATVTNLINKNDLFDMTVLSGTPGSNNGLNEAQFSFSSTFNWARTPKVAYVFRGGNFNQSMPNPQDHDVLLSGLTNTRYSLGGDVTWDGNLTLSLLAVMKG